MSQFILALCTLVYHTYLRLRVKSCDGGKRVDQLGFVIYGSYLLLFLKFFIGKYNAAPARPTSGAGAGAKSSKVDPKRAQMVKVADDEEDDQGDKKLKLKGS